MRNTLAMMSSLRNGYGYAYANCTIIKSATSPSVAFLFSIVMTEFIKAVEMQSAKDKVDIDEKCQLP